MQASKTKMWSTAGLIFIGVIAGIIFASNFNWTSKGFASRNDAPIVLGTQEKPSDAVLELQNTGKAFTAVSKEMLPTVVSVATSKIVKRSQRQDDFWSPIFRDFFGRENQNQQPQTERLQGLGSGVIVSKDGYILTNHHVIVDADDIKVRLYDNRTFEAELVGTDPLTEVAVIKIKGANFPAARLGDSDKLEVGEWVLAIGNPLELYSTVTAGIVSAKGRSIGIIRDRDSNESGGSYAIENFIQTDAAINRGNSGGALVNLKAEVVGINTAIATGTGFYAGYGFAVPINLAKKIMNDLIAKGYVTRAWLGIAMRSDPMTEEIAERFKLGRPRGILIEQVFDDSPAKDAGLQVFDIILELDGKEMNQSNEVQNAVALKNPRDIVTLKILRDSKERMIRVKLGQRETGRESVQASNEEEYPKLGLEVQNLTDELRSRLGYAEDNEGVLVTNVEQYSTAYDARIRRGDLVIRIEGDRISSVSDYKKSLRKYEKGKVVIFYLKRQDTELHAFVKLPK